MTIQIIKIEFTNLLDGPNGDIRFRLDNRVTCMEVTDRLEITGWANHRKRFIAEVILVSGANTLAKSRLHVVSQLFARFFNTESARFRLLSSELPEGSFFLNIAYKNGETIPIARFELVEYSRPKLLFMHIAKAAGSSVNNFFARHYAENQFAIHIESNELLQSAPDTLKKMDFLAGHKTLFELDKTLDLDDYYKVTVVREPYAQLCSHLSWIKRLSAPGEEQRFEQHPAHIQVFARKLSKVDFADPDAIKALLQSLEDREMRLVDNCQVRYFTRVPLGEAVCDAHTREAFKASAAFDKIGTVEALGKFLKGVANEMLWPEPEDQVRENVTQSFYGLDLSNKSTRSALEPLVKHDLILYARLQTEGVNLTV